MINLSHIAGLPINLAGGRLEFFGGLKAVEPATRQLEQARYAFCDGEATGVEDLYFMYRDVAWCEEREKLAALGLRFDLTLIPPGLIGQEYNKTVGHYHPVKAGTTVTFPEVYEVLHGEAVYLLQRPAVNHREAFRFPLNLRAESRQPPATSRQGTSTVCQVLSAKCQVQFHNIGYKLVP